MEVIQSSCRVSKKETVSFYCSKSKSMTCRCPIRILSLILIVIVIVILILVLSIRIRYCLWLLIIGHVIELDDYD